MNRDLIKVTKTNKKLNAHILNSKQYSNLYMKEMKSYGSLKVLKNDKLLGQNVAHGGLERVFNNIKNQ